MVRLHLCRRLAPVAALLLLLWFARASAGTVKAQETYFFLLFPQLMPGESTPGQPSPGEATPDEPSLGEAVAL